MQREHNIDIQYILIHLPILPFHATLHQDRVRNLLYNHLQNNQMQLGDYAVYPGGKFPIFDFNAEVPFSTFFNGFGLTTSLFLYGSL